MDLKAIKPQLFKLSVFHGMYRPFRFAIHSCVLVIGRSTLEPSPKFNMSTSHNVSNIGKSYIIWDHPMIMNDLGKKVNRFAWIKSIETTIGILKVG